MKNIVLLVGIETVRGKDGKVIKLSETFVNNARTFEKDNRKDHVIRIDARNYLTADNPIGELWHDVCMSYGHSEGLAIDELIYMGHSDSTTLYVFSRVCTEHPDEQRFLSSYSDFTAPYNKNAAIRLISCQAGGERGKKFDDCIAQTIADQTKRTVYAYTSRCAQIRRRDGGFEQRPDYPGFAKFVARADANAPSGEVPESAK